MERAVGARCWCYCRRQSAAAGALAGRGRHDCWRMMGSHASGRRSWCAGHDAKATEALAMAWLAPAVDAGAVLLAVSSGSERRSTKIKLKVSPLLISVFGRNQLNAY